jgi:hypothetical protein
MGVALEQQTRRRRDIHSGNAGFQSLGTCGPRNQQEDQAKKTSSRSQSHFCHLSETLLAGRLMLDGDCQAANSITAEHSEIMPTTRFMIGLQQISSQ